MQQLAAPLHPTSFAHILQPISFAHTYHHSTRYKSREAVCQARESIKPP